MRCELSGRDLAALGADVLIIPHFSGRPFGPIGVEIDAALKGHLTDLRATGEGRADFPVLAIARAGGSSPVAAILGLGELSLLDGYRFRNALQLAVRGLRRWARRVSVAVEPDLVIAFGGDPQATVRGVVEGVCLGNFEAGEFRSAPTYPGQVDTVIVAGLDDDDGSIQKVAETAVLFGEAGNFVRKLQWRPSNLLTPSALATEAVALAQSSNLTVEVLNIDEITALGMGAFLAVARGSVEPPRLIVLRYRPRQPSDDGRRLALVGKGITFDSGGISLKTPSGMKGMKADMTGGAAVISAMGVIAAIEPGIPVFGVVPVTENMPGGRATKPGDVVTALNGKTIEITNTDAEGRLVLADAIAYAVREGATHIIDIATLTSASEIALGQTISAALTNDPRLLQAVVTAAGLAGERIWELPILPEHQVALHSDVADMKNLDDSEPAGAIAGAVFLREFVGGSSWVHMDVCPAIGQESLYPLIPKGPTGVATRTLAHLPSVLSAQHTGALASAKV